MILELQFGAGGNDAKLFVEELLEAYLKYAKRKGITSEVLDQSDGHALVKLSGKNVFDVFKHEAGKHCVQRDSSGKPHTSMVTVGVLDLPPEEKQKILPESEIDIKTQGGHGKGGQHQNKTDSAVRMTHIPTGIQVFINGRKQVNNKKEALRILTQRVNEFHLSQKKEAYDQQRKNQVGNTGRSEKLRTYNYMNKTVIDHVRGRESKQLKKILKGRFDLI